MRVIRVEFKDYDTARKYVEELSIPGAYACGPDVKFEVSSTVIAQAIAKHIIDAISFHDVVEIRVTRD